MYFLTIYISVIITTPTQEGCVLYQVVGIRDKCKLFRNTKSTQHISKYSLEYFHTTFSPPFSSLFLLLLFYFIYIILLFHLLTTTTTTRVRKTATTNHNNNNTPPPKKKGFLIPFSVSSIFYRSPSSRTIEHSGRNKLICDGTDRRGSAPTRGVRAGRRGV